MIVINVPESDTNCVQIHLPFVNMEVDPRGMGKLFTTKFRISRKFQFTVDGRVLIIQRMDSDGWRYPFRLRVYDPATETVPDFKSTKYTYLGVDGEQAPRDTTLAIIHASVNTIKKMAFKDCTHMKECTMGDEVFEICAQSFQNCRAMRVVRLSRNLRRIGCRAFAGCTSIDAFFLPSGERLHQIERGAFDGCIALRILPISPSTRFSGDDDTDGDDEIVRDCDALQEQIQYEFRRSMKLSRLGCIFHIHGNGKSRRNQTQQTLQWLRMRHDHLPLHQICLDPSVTVQMIDNFIQTFGTSAAFQVDGMKMTPLHILSMNPHATPGCMETCFHANPLAVINQDCRGMNPVDYLWRYNNVEGIVYLMQALSLLREGMLANTFTLTTSISASSSENRKRSWFQMLRDLRKRR